MSKQFEEELDQAYEKSLDLALSISKATSKNRDHSLISQIKRNYQEFRDIQGKHVKNSRSIEVKSPSILVVRKSHISTFSKSGQAKAFLSKSIEESNLNIKLSRAGKSSLRYAENYPQKITKFSKSCDKNSHPLPHVSLLNGKTELPLNLPFYKDYVLKSNEKVEEKNPVMEKIERCEESLKDFYKSINGLELFCSGNPGVPWNNDKKILHKLYENPNYKASIIRNYNDSLHGNNKFRARSTLSRLSLIYKKTSSRSSIDSSPLGKAPTPAGGFGRDKDLEEILELRPNTASVYEDPESILERCSTRFINAKNEENEKLINIFKKIKKNRPWYLRQKGELIMHDDDHYKNKLYTLKKFDMFRKKINSRQEKRLEQNKLQAKIYIELLDVLVNEVSPSELEISFVNLIRHILEEGWVLSNELISGIVSRLSLQDSQQLTFLVSIIQNYLNSIT